jgi:hypothetical protein
MPPKMLIRMPFTFLSDIRILNAFRDLLLVGAAADVEEVGRLAARQLDDVHRRHRQAGAVDHAADVAIELDVVERELRRLDLERVLFAEVAQLLACPCRNSALSSKPIFASSARTLPSAVVTIIGLISTIEQSSLDVGVTRWRRDQLGDGLAQVLGLEPEVANASCAGLEGLQANGRVR